jgi:drug/metabolite transporter (DMT)-like permease
VISIASLFFALKWGEFGKMNLIYTLGTVWAFLGSIVLLGERPSKFTWGAIPLAVLGLFFVFSPHGHPNLYADIMAIIGSLTSGYVYLCLKQLRTNHNAISIVFSFYIAGLVAFFVPTFLNFVWPDVYNLLILIMIGLSGFCAQILMTIGYRYTQVSVATPIKLTSIVSMIIIGILIFKDPFNIVLGTGVVLILTAIFMVARYQ